MVKYLGLGQEATFMYGHRPKNDKEETYRDADLGVLIELHKQFTAMHRWMTKAPPETGEQLLQHVSHIDYLTDEVARLIPKLPDHKAMGVEQPEKLMFIAAAKHARNFSI